MGEECSDFRDAHFFGMTFIVEEDEVFCPLNVGIFGTGGVAFDAEGIAILVEEFFLFR